MTVFTQSLIKLAVVNVDSGGMVDAFCNPKEISIDKSVPWNKHKRPKGDTPLLEFTNAENRTCSFELLFDTSELGVSVWMTKVKLLSSYTQIIEAKKRPPLVMLVWGAPEGASGFPTFKGVIESLATKYTMFLPDGTPIRATCTIKMKEADQVQFKEEKG